MRTLPALVLLAGGLGAPLAAAPPDARQSEDLAPPFAVVVDGAPLDTPPGAESTYRDDNSYPLFGDFDGDGRPDLLIGQGRHGESGEGHLRIYRNVGEPGDPRFGKPIWFDDQSPTGRIPSG